MTVETDREKAYRLLKDRAYRMLSRREYSRHELRQQLARHDGFGQLEVLLDLLIAEGSQSDRRFAEVLGRLRYRTGKGPRVLEQELRRHRLDEEIVLEIMAEYQGSWRELADQVRLKKFGGKPPGSYREWTKQARFLLQRGFTTEQIGGYDGE